MTTGSSSTGCGRPCENGDVERRYTTEEAAEVAGVTYRQLDYWLRQGYVVIGAPAHGCGSRRKFATDEVAALVRCVGRMRSAQATLDSFSDGSMWESELHLPVPA